MRLEAFKFWDLEWLILEVLPYIKGLMVDKYFPATWGKKRSCWIKFKQHVAAYIDPNENLLRKAANMQQIVY